MNVQEAKERIGDVWQLGRTLGWPLSGRRTDFAFWRGSHRTPSVSFTADGRAWHDFGTGEKGDIVALLAKVEGLSSRDACRRLITLVGGTPGGAASTSLPPLRARVAASASVAEERRMERDAEAAEKRARWPEFRPLADADAREVAHQRRLPGTAGVLAAARRGLLVEVPWVDRGPYAVRAWGLTDGARCAAQVRRLDGQPWEHGKSKSLPGSVGGWPIGAAEIGERTEVVLTEGEPDLLAALTLHCHLAVRPGAGGGDGGEGGAGGAGGDEARGPHDPGTLGFACLTGGAKRIAEAALPLFRGKIVHLAPHCDATGIGAVDTWAAQLLDAGAVVHVFDLAGLTTDDGRPAKDLNDVVTSAGLAARREVLAELFTAQPREGSGA
jgi:hypothetical protein